MKLLIIYALAFGLLPILALILRLKIVQWAKTNKQKTDRALKKHYEKEYEKIYQEEYKPYYEETVQLFNKKIKGKQMDRKQILEFKKLVNKSLGSYKSVYDNWHFKNDAMEIYSKLKDIHIDKSDFIKLINYLERV